MQMLLLPMYAASLCSDEWLEQCKDYADDPDVLSYVLSDFCPIHRILLCDACGACELCSPNACYTNHVFL